MSILPGAPADRATIHAADPVRIARVAARLTGARAATVLVHGVVAEHATAPDRIAGTTGALGICP